MNNYLIYKLQYYIRKGFFKKVSLQNLNTNPPLRWSFSMDLYSYSFLHLISFLKFSLKLGCIRNRSTFSVHALYKRGIQD